jgi:Dyp-type peroxidase family
MTVFLPGEEELFVDTRQIQGNVVPGFKADHEHLRGVRFADARRARDWLAAVLARITTAADVYEHRRLEHDPGTDTGSAPEHPWASVALTAPALELLGFSGAFADAAFRVGIEERSSILGDDPADHDSWRVGGGRPIHALIIVAAKSAEDARDAADELTVADGVETVYREAGATLARRGHEHFGFRDGVSHPALLGRQPMPPHDPLTRRDWDSVPAAPSVVEAAPGRVLLWPGEFVFGCRGQSSVAHLAGDVHHAGRGDTTLTVNGSFLVVRRLRQDVACFHRVCREKAAELAGAWPGMSAELLEALVVGRWPSGAPVDARATADPGVDGDVPNAFDFSDDPDGRACPFAAHIRKVNPRAQASVDVPSLQRRMMRRGIPYGSEPTDPTVDDGVDRGLLFISYQTSIVQQFEKVVDEWMNHPDRPAKVGAGQDVLVGQVQTGGRSMRLLRGNDSIPLETTARWIRPTGGVYAFAPSLLALERMAEGP